MVFHIRNLTVRINSNQTNHSPEKVPTGADALRFGVPSRIHNIKWSAVLFCAVLSLGIFARTWEFRSLPPGLNEDEASSAVDAFSLYHYGIDRNGISYPIYLISWGSGQNALNAYAMIPFIAAGGLNTFTIRLPALIAGILTLPLMYFIGLRTAGEKFALAAMFLLSISPWHILISRWGFEGNLLPFVFSIGYLCLLKSRVDNKWFIPAMLCMGLCLYTYGPAYAAVPLFLLCALPILLRTGKITVKKLLSGLALLIMLATPIALFLLINARHLDSIHLGIITIPRLPAVPRYQTISGIFHQNTLQVLLHNLKDLFSLLWVQEDGFFFSTVRPYGYFYVYTLPFAILGLILLIAIPRWKWSAERMLLLAWLGVGLALGTLESVNITRVNLIFIPILFCIASVLTWVFEHSKIGLVLVVSVFLVAFIFFTRDYHGQHYRASADKEFNAGLLQAITFASERTDTPICITNSVNMPYIHVLFSQQMDPNNYLRTIKYVNPHAIFRQVMHLDRFSFGLRACPTDMRTIYVLANEIPSQPDISYTSTSFNRFTVFIPEPITK